MLRLHWWWCDVTASSSPRAGGTKETSERLSVQSGLWIHMIGKGSCVVCGVCGVNFRHDHV